MNHTAINDIKEIASFSSYAVNGWNGQRGNNDRGNIITEEEAKDNFFRE